MVIPAHINGAACSNDIEEGIVTEDRASIRQYSAKPPSRVKPTMLERKVTLRSTVFVTVYPADSVQYVASL